MKIRGTVEQEELEGGLWVLRTASGESYTLADPPRELLRPGLEVEVEANLREDLMGFGMMDGILEVGSWKPVRKE